MKDIAIMIVFLTAGEPLRFEVPWPACLAEYRRWRYADATGKTVTASNRELGLEFDVREIRCENRREPEPTS